MFRNLAGRKDTFRPPFKEINMLTPIYNPGTRGWTKRYLNRQLSAAQKSDVTKRYKVSPERFQDYAQTLLDHPRDGADWYDAVYSIAGPKRLCFDVSPSYARLGTDAAAYLAQNCPESQLVYILRAPKKRALSHLRMLVSRRGVPPHGDGWSALAQDAVAGNLYAQNVPRWQAAFGDRLMCLPFGLIKSDPRAFLSTVEMFAGWPAGNYGLAEEKIHQTEPVEIPEEVSAYLDRLLMGEEGFLRTAFGDEFVDLM